MQLEEVITKLKGQANPKNVEGMVKFGVSIPVLRKLAKEIGTNHSLALQLWKSGIHEARILAGYIDDPQQVTEKQIESWVKDFDSWDICDQICSSLFDKTPFAYQKVYEWVERGEEFVRRAGFVMMACLSVHDKKANDSKFIQFFPLIRKYATDERNFVRKAVNWALRQIGKRNERLLKLAIEQGREIEKINSKSARWIAKDALRELNSKL